MKGVEHRLARNADQPAKGSSNSRINKIAPETATVEAIKARMAVALGGARRLKPRKMTTSQETRMMSIAFEIEATDLRREQ